MTLRKAILIPTLGLPIISGIFLGLNGGGWYYLGLLVAMLISLGVAEFLSVKKRGRTISKDISLMPKWLFWFVVGSFLFLGVGMSVHWILFL